MAFRISPDQTTNPYTMPAGPELDQLVHNILMDDADSGRAPRYSTDDAQVERLQASARSRFGVKVMVGRTTIRRKPWFARYGTDPSQMTEVIAETCPLALSRIVVVLALRPAQQEQ
jgi:hypothetical protein